MCINNPGHMTKMAAMPIYGKNPSKFFFSGTGGPIATKKSLYGCMDDGCMYEVWMTQVLQCIYKS